MDKDEMLKFSMDNIETLKFMLSFCKITCFGETQINLPKQIIDVITELQKRQA